MNVRIPLEKKTSFEYFPSGSLPFSHPYWHSSLIASAVNKFRLKERFFLLRGYYLAEKYMFNAGGD